MIEVISNSLHETREFGEKIAKQLKAGATVLLYGDLGSGKTVFSSGFVKEATGIMHNVTSPTFTIVQEYEGKTKVNHFDLYRIGGLEELEAIGVYEYLFDDSAISLIEWPERVPELVDILKTVYECRIEKLGDNSRKIKFEKIKG